MFENGIYSWRESCGKNLSIAIAGDVCPGDHAADAILNGESRKILQEIQPALDRADLRLVQWETVISGHWKLITKSGPNLLVPPGCEAFITAGRFDVALLANNHIGDHSPAGVLDTIRHIRNAGVRTVGAGCNSADAAKPLHLEKKRVVHFHPEFLRDGVRDCRGGCAWKQCHGRDGGSSSNPLRTQGK